MEADKQLMPYFHCSSAWLASGSVIRSGNWGRIIRKAGWSHNLALREAFYEHIRQEEFPALPSRLDAAFFFDSVEEAQVYFGADQMRALTNVIYEVRILDPKAPLHRADWRASSPSGDYGAEPIRAYWRGVHNPALPTGQTCSEILSITDLQVVRAL